MQEGPVAVVQGHSPATGWADLAEAALAIRAGVLWVAANVDKTLPSERGLLPGNGSMVAALRGPDWLASLLTDGVVAGVGSVLVFVPVIFAMMFFITFLEGSGYMARAAFVMDRAMHSMGLHGKSFIPMLLGFGCTVPAIYATRTLENPRDKLMTALLVPLMSCGARLPVYVLFTAAFFRKARGWCSGPST
jgi:Fe2+ transport system protein B